VIALVSANLGGLDPALALPAHPGIRATYYTDRPATLPGWDRVVQVYAVGGPRLSAKLYKCQIQRTADAPDATWYLWADACLRFSSLDFAAGLARSIGTDGRRAAFVPHPARKSPGEEWEYVLQGVRAGHPYLAARYNVSELECERDHFARRHNIWQLPLWCGGLWMMARSERTDAFLDDWWFNVRNHCILDQAAIAPLLVEHGIQPVPIPVNIYKNQFWERVSHA